MPSRSIAMFSGSMLLLLAWAIAAAQDRHASKKAPMVPAAPEPIATTW